jgi:hypothetical protein
MDMLAEIKGIEYSPFMCRELHTFVFDEIEKALSKEATFILRMGKGSEIAISRWVSSKRTRSYPYARVYDSLSFIGKKVTFIPLMKDEGIQGDRDFLQWDTVSLMSLLGIYVIITFYSDASVSRRYEGKITKQKFDLDHIRNEINRLTSYQSDALHWNLYQLDNIGTIGQKALQAYQNISTKLGVSMHSRQSAEKRIQQLLEGKDFFMDLSRDLAKRAQNRESITKQPKEWLMGAKGTITIHNYLGGYYYFTCDEVETHGKEVYLIEGKHTKTPRLPSLGDIKDGLLKMILFTNLENTTINGVPYNRIPILKLTTGAGFIMESLKQHQIKLLDILRKEAQTNRFRVLINDKFFV